MNLYSPPCSCWAYSLSPIGLIDFCTVLDFLAKLALALIGVLAAAGLTVGKAALDGPSFDGDEATMQGKTVVITGANTGLGYETAKKMALLGADRVILLCRNESLGQSAIDRIMSLGKVPTRTILQTLPLDLADQRGIVESARLVASSVGVDGIDVLICNAGVMAVPTNTKTRDGYEMQLGVNHLGHFRLVKELWPSLKLSKGGARVISVSSAAHFLGSLSTPDQRLNLMLDENYDPWRAYGNSKLANILFIRALAARIKRGNVPGMKAFSLHPGGCRTDLARYILDPSKISVPARLALGVAAAPLFYFTKSAEAGAQTQIFLAADTKTVPQFYNGEYFDNSKVASTSTEAQSAEEAEWLWAESERLTGCSFKV
jgi:NAD(P)-dependent dehydrogenase (short-subunit alcohol dehydrogenase family)